MKRNRKNHGFTLVETLVSIAILMIAIAGPLVVANKGLVAALYAKDQSVANMLAQEGMEEVRNLKDQAIFNDPTNGFANLFFIPNSPLYVSPISLYNCSASQTAQNLCGINLKYIMGGSYEIFPYKCLGIDSQCKLTSDGVDLAYSSWGGSGQTPLFSRSFSWVSINNNEVQVTVTVSWYEGTVSNSVSVSEDMVATVQ